MILQPGSPLGAYEIIALLGTGGMGEVYRARDTSLGRDVALKVLSAPLAAAPDQQARFAREARALAALNHPHIAAIYGFESIGDIQLLVMELVEGATLADRLDAGRLPLAEALAAARQIAEALEAAHQKGIVHRDLKPANIKVTGDGRVKVLDFGLAKAAAGAEFDKSLPTAADATRDGAIVGTAPYMSPEQARGLAVDRRTDIWAFGCILYDMVAGRRAFDGDTVADILASIIERDPDFSRLPATTPPDLVRVIRRCLVKDPAKRLHDIADARLEIEEVISTPAAPATAAATRPRTASARGVRIALGVALTVAGLIAGIVLQRYALSSGVTTAEAPRSTAFGFSEPQGDQLYLFVDPIKISPDGRQIAFVTTGPQGLPRLWLRSMDSIAPVLVENTEGAMFPFWSPDGRSIAFVAQGELRVLDLASRSVRTLAPSRNALAGGTWSRNGTILYVDGFSGLKRIPAGGGEPSEVTSTGSTPGKVLHAFPQFLPDGRHFLYVEKNNFLGGASAVMLGDLESTARTRVLATESQAIFAPPDHLVYLREGALVAVRFDPVRLEVSGDPVELGFQAWSAGSGLMAASASDTGVLAFASRRVQTTELTWIDRSGRPLGTLGGRGWWVHVDISPDGKTVVAERLEPRTGSGGLWTIDRARGVPSRFTLDPSWNLAPVWSATGARVAFGSSRSGVSDLYVRAGDGSGEDTEVSRSSVLTVPTSWTPRDDRLVFNRITAATGSDIVMLTPGGNREETVLVQTPFNEGSGKVAPDGRWLAYASNETGRQEVYVRPFERPGPRVQISTSGGSQPRWRRDGKELFFISEDGRLMAARLSAGATLDVQPPELLPVAVERDITGWRYTYDVAEDGQRFLAIRSAGVDPAPPIMVMVNWASGLHR